MSSLLAWTNYGPYHVARMRAAQRRCGIAALEWAGHQRLYRWEAERAGVEIETLMEGAYEECPQWRLAAKAAGAVLRRRPRVLFVPGYSQKAAIALAVAGRITGARLVLMSESNRMDRERRGVAEWLKGLYVKGMFRYGFVAGEWSAKYLAELGIPEERQRRNYDVVDAPRLAEMAASARRGGEGRAREFLYVGRFAPEKNLFGLLRGYGRYRGGGGDWRLHLVGHGPLERELERMIGDMGLTGAVRMTGYRPLEELAPLYAGCGAFVLPSLSEPWGLVVNEAISCGAPVLVSERCGCAPELVDATEGGNGLLIRGPEDVAIAEAMGAMAGFGEERREAMSRKSSLIAQRYRPEEFAQSVAELIEMAERGV